MLTVTDNPIDAIVPLRKPLENKEVLLIIAHRDFRDEEYLIPKNILEQMGANITTASSSITVAKGMIDTEVKPDIIITDVVATDFDAIVFIGGSGAKEYFNDSTALKIVNLAFENKQVIGAICLAPAILAQAGILRFKPATVWESRETKAIFKTSKVQYTGRQVEVSGKIITANGPEASKLFAEEIARLLIREGLIE